MSELCMSNTTKKSQFSSHIISDFVMLFYMVLSHPLYFSYFVFFSPYILKLLSFLSPLFVTTSLLLLAFLTLSSSLINESSTSHLPETKKGFLDFVYNIFEKISSRADSEVEEFSKFEEFELYKIVFDVSMYGVEECLEDEFSDLNCEEKCIQPIESTVNEGINECLDVQLTELSCEEKCVVPVEETVDYTSRDAGSRIVDDSVDMSGENPEVVSQPFVKAMMLKDFRQEHSYFNNVFCCKDEKEIKPAAAEFDKVDKQEEKNSIRGGSKILDSKVRELIGKADIGNDEQLTSKVFEDPQGKEEYLQKSDKVENCASNLVKENSRRLGENLRLHVKDDDFIERVDGSFSPSLSSFGSMRKEKEWRRTLACKLFEERHSVQVGGSEGMDLLWETYENKESVKVKKKGDAKKDKGYYECEDDDDEDEDIDGQLCCLQALKFSAGKMNLGMGRPNLVKISKAFKGIGWLQSMSRRDKKNCS